MPQHIEAPTALEEEEHYQAAPSPLNTSLQSQRAVSAPNTAYPTTAVNPTPATQRSISVIMENGRAHEEDSPMLNETLSVIDEHITDMNTPRSSVLASDLRGFNDSGSEYSSHMGHRTSYINGNETDEEERAAHSQTEVSRWTPDQVAEYLEDIGVEGRHCEIFKEQEISGEVLLNIDQATLFMKEFDLGPVGRRLRTWHKIKALQEEVQHNSRQQTRRQTQHYQNFGRNISVESLTGSISQASFNSSGIPRISAMGSPAARHLRQGSPLAESYSPDTVHYPRLGHPLSQPPEGPGRHLSAPHTHSRRHSSVDMHAKASQSLASEASTSATTTHVKKPSFDKNWTMGSAAGSPTHNRTSLAIVSSSLGMSGHAVSPNVLDYESNDANKDLDRGYFSGTDGEGRKLRNVLRKRESASASHSRQSSATTGNQTANKRHSRFGSAGSIGKAIASVTSGARSQSRSRTKSTAEPNQHNAGQNDLTSPIVTHLDYSESPTSASKSEIASTEQDGSSQRSLAQSGASNEKPLSMSPTLVSSPNKDPSTRSSPPSRTTSTATSGASKSLEMDKSSTATGGMTPTSGTKRTKTKKQTSAYTRGLLKQNPQEAMLSCDYSGWMKKKSPSLIATWKPRLFVLRGRRLSYYYTENDIEEQGLIDISNHKVLPADDLLTGIHATVTGAKSTPTSPANAHTETKNDAEVAAQADSSLQKPGAEGMFIFKLIPPRAGLSRAVNFTKPTVHYFAVDNIKQGRLWMAALMKATIEKDETKPITSTYSQKTISLSKAKQMKQRPPALMNVEEDSEVKEPASTQVEPDDAGLNIQGLNLSYEYLVNETTKESNVNGRPASEQPKSAPLSTDPQADRPASVDRPQMNSKNVKNDTATSSLRMVRSHSGSLSRGTGASIDRTIGPDHRHISTGTANTASDA